jgi:hypothetical protein
LFLILVGRAQAPVWDVSANHHIEKKKPMPYVNLESGRLWMQWLRGGEQLGSPYEQTGPSPAPRNGYAVTANVAANAAAVSRSNSASARSAPSYAADSCTRRHGLRRAKS